MTVGAILLAAGSARRMGENKLLADLGGKPLFLHAFEAIGAAGFGKPIVAVAPGSRLAALIEGRARLVEVADHALGMGCSLAAAVRAAPSHWMAALVCLGDMPFVRASTLIALAQRASADAIVRPCYQQRPGNPVLWGRDHFGQLAGLTGDHGGRALFARHPATLLDCDDPGVEIDVDTPEALERARRLVAG